MSTPELLSLIAILVTNGVISIIGLLRIEHRITKIERDQHWITIKLKED